MNKLLRLLMGAGLYLLEPDRVQAVRENLADRLDDLSDRAERKYQAAVERMESATRAIRGREDHGAGNVVAFVLGIGAGVGLGMLFAPASGEETRGNIAEKVQGIRDRFSSKPQPPTGTYGQ